VYRVTDARGKPVILARRRTQGDRAAELPVVARLVVEIRSDGVRTVARGAMTDAASGRTVALEARGRSMGQLAGALARSVWRRSSRARAVVRGLIRARRR